MLDDALVLDLDHALDRAKQIQRVMKVWDKEHTEAFFSITLIIFILSNYKEGS